jgi:hypothetical protein
MKTGRRRFVVFAGVFLMTAGMVLGGAFAGAASPACLRERDRIAVSVPPSAAGDAMKLTADDAAAIAEKLQAPVAWWGTRRTAVLTERRQVQADVYAVGGPFADFHPVKMLFGSFLSRTGGTGNAAVLNRDLAWDLFGTLDVLGMEVRLEGRTYIVAGVCETDETLLGLLSGNGAGRAYVPFDPAGGIPVSGMEASLEKSVPGKSLQAVKDALGGEGKATSSFLFSDITERARLDAEAAGLPAVAYICVLAVMLAVIAKRAVSAMTRGLREILRQNYFREVWRNTLLRTGGMLLAIATAAGVACLLFALTGFPFFLPARFIPGSLIDFDFYRELIKSETAAAVAGLGFIPPPWEILHDAGMRLAGFMDMIALTGIAVFVAGLNLLKDAGRNGEGTVRGWRSGAWDVPCVWVCLALSIGVSLLLSAAAGLPAYLPVGLAVDLWFGSSLLAAQILYGDGFKGILIKLPAGRHGAKDIPAAENPATNDFK